MASPFMVAFTYYQESSDVTPQAQGYKYFIQLHTSGSPSRVFLDPIAVVAQGNDLIHVDIPECFCYNQLWIYFKFQGVAYCLDSIIGPNPEFQKEKGLMIWVIAALTSDKIWDTCQCCDASYVSVCDVA